MRFENPRGETLLDFNAWEDNVKSNLVAAKPTGRSVHAAHPMQSHLSNSGPRIAITSSGLGHIRRGIESWAEDTAHALIRSGADVMLFQGAGPSSEPWRRTLPCLRRFEPANNRILAVTRHLGGWRYGLGSPYDIEQTSFSIALWQATHSSFDILHMQDPTVALCMDRLHRLGLSRPRVILGHGTEESNELLGKLSYLQHLTPNYRDEYEVHRPAKQLSFGVPNFIDTHRFRPVGDATHRATARAQFNIAADAFVILCVAAIKQTHKRCDYLIREFAELRTQLPADVASSLRLVIAGGRDAETPNVIAMGRQALGDSLLILESVDRDRLATLYQAADIFAIASLHEMMPIALLEALSSGLPASCNATPTLRWMVGPAGHPEDISQPGGLVRQWLPLLDPGVRSELSRNARTHVEETFSESRVLGQIKAMYQAVLEARQ